jgi:hypothetical protein
MTMKTDTMRSDAPRWVIDQPLQNLDPLSDTLPREHSEAEEQRIRPAGTVGRVDAGRVELDAGGNTTKARRRPGKTVLENDPMYTTRAGTIS